MNRTNHETEIVSTLWRAVADRLGSGRFQLWFSATHWEYHHGVLVIRGHDQFRLRWLESKMRKEIASICLATTGTTVDIRFEQLEDGDLVSDGTGVRLGFEGTEPCESASAAASERVIQGSSGDGATESRTLAVRQRHYARLEEYVVGASNQVAVASIRMVIGQPGQINPLFMYGPPGSGKTHLAEGVYRAIRAMTGRRRCLFLTAEQFTSHFLTSLHGRGTPSFRQRYRHVDLLVVEDVQFFGNKPTTIQEIHHTADSVQKDGGQLVFTADRSPKELAHLGQDLVTRFCGGMVARLEPLDEPTRCELLRRQAEQRQIAMDTSTAELVASRLTGDARHVIGALVRLQAYSTAWQKPITPELALEALDDLFQVQSRVVRLDEIERIVCEVFGIESQKLQSKNRTQRVTQPRMLAMWLARKHTSSALSEIGHHFGKRSHSSVVMAEKKINAMFASKSHLRTADGNVGVHDVVRRIEQRLMVG